MGTTALSAAQLADGYRMTPIEDHGKVRIRYFSFTQVGAGDVGSTVDLCDLPPGRVRILPQLSKLKNSAFGAGALLNIGHLAYQARDSGAADPQAADPVALTPNAIDVSVAEDGVAIGQLLKFDVYSKAGIRLQATLAGAGIPDAATLSGYIAYIYE